MACPGSTFAKATPVGAFVLFVCCAAGMAQSAPPPPAVSVKPAVSRQVTETGDFVGRVVAIEKVDIVAFRMPRHPYLAR